MLKGYHKDFCLRGHEKTIENTGHQSSCKICRREKNRDNYQKEVQHVPCSRCGKERTNIPGMRQTPQLCSVCSYEEKHVYVLERWALRYPSALNIRFGKGYVVYGDFLCPACGDKHRSSLPDLNRRSSKRPKTLCRRCSIIISKNEDLSTESLRDFFKKHAESATNLGEDVSKVVSFVLFRHSSISRSKHSATIPILEMPVIPKFCPIFSWIELKIGRATGFLWTRKKGSKSERFVSLDRIDSRFGYVSGNVMWVSLRANVLKRDANLDELKALGTYALKTA